MPSVLERYYNMGFQEGFQKGFQEGFQKCFQEGFQKGFQEERAWSLIIVLDKRFPDAETDALRQLIKQVEDIEKLQVLFDFALDCVSIDEFEEKFSEIVPEDISMLAV